MKTGPSRKIVDLRPLLVVPAMLALTGAGCTSPQRHQAGQAWGRSLCVPLKGADRLDCVGRADAPSAESQRGTIVSDPR